MKSTQLKLVAALLVACSFSAQADAQGNQEGGGLVTVLDVAKVFELNPAFNAKMKEIKGQADVLKSQIQADQEKIRQDALTLQNYEVGSAERNQLEASLEQRQATLRTTARQSEQELLNREAGIYFETYQMMQEVVTKVASENNISLVLRYDSAKIDKTNRAEVIKGVNRTVVYHRQLDLTSLVSDAMNARTANAGAGTMQR